MAINKGPLPFIGTRDGINGYFRGEVNIIRAASPLSRDRVKEDPAFEGFRKSGNRMKEAAPIAAALYNQIPKEQKQFSLYRVLTGEVLKMINQGIDKSEITEKLQQLYIAPILRQLQKQPTVMKHVGPATRSHFPGNHLFTVFPVTRCRSRLARKQVLQPSNIRVDE